MVSECHAAAMGLLRSMAAAGVEMQPDGLYLPNFLEGTMRGEAPPGLPAGLHALAAIGKLQGQPHFRQTCGHALCATRSPPEPPLSLARPTADVMALKRLEGTEGREERALLKKRKAAIDQKAVAETAYKARRTTPADTAAQAAEAAKAAQAQVGPAAIL